MNAHVRQIALATTALWISLSMSAPARLISYNARCVELRCDGLKEPLAASATPRLSWSITHSLRHSKLIAYQVLVASREPLLNQDQGDLWDSGKQAKGRQPDVTYAGQPLQSGQRVWWKVRFWDANGHASPWSTPASFEVAPTSPSDWLGAQWIDDGKPIPENDEDFYKEDPAPLLRREFHLNKPIQRARLHIAGLGLYYPSLNGARLNDHLFEPAWTHFDQRILFRTHDVTDQLKSGANCLGIELGNGWYNPLPLRMWGNLNIRKSLPLGRPRAIALLIVDHNDGSRSIITTNEQWQTTEGPTLKNSIYLGEVRDSRQSIPNWNQPGLNTSSWKPVRSVNAPLDVLQPLHMLPVRAMETLQPTTITPTNPNAFIVDFGTNFTGIPEITFNAPAGTRISLRYGELLHPDGSLNPLTSVCGQIKGMIVDQDGNSRPKGGPGAPEFAWQQDTVIASGGTQSYRPDFTFRAFRYLEITGLPTPPNKDQVHGIVFHTELPLTGSFECSNPLLNRIQQMCLRTFHSNMITVQSDCPHRERFGYGGDICATSETFMMNFNMNGFYSKTVRDWGDAQLPNGLMPDTAPNVGIQYCGVGWGMVHPQLLEQIYQHYGQLELIHEQLHVAIRWIDAEAARRVNGLVATGLGDHEAIDPKYDSNMEAIRTPMFIDAAKRIARLARLIGNESAAQRCDTYAEESLAAWTKAFLNTSNGVIADNTQTHLTMALGFGVVSNTDAPNVFDQLTQQLTQSNDGPRLSTGIYGTWKLLELLPAKGRNDLAYSLATRKTFPSWGWMLENNATTLWEHWQLNESTFSHNHPMFGSISGWFYRWLGGIQCAPDAIGFDRILIQPQPVNGLEWVKTSHQSIRGTITSNWQQTTDGITYDIVIPPDTIANIRLPHGRASTITESDTDLIPFTKSHALIECHQDEHATHLKVGSGHYRFHCSR